MTHDSLADLALKDVETAMQNLHCFKTTINAYAFLKGRGLLRDFNEYCASNAHKFKVETFFDPEDQRMIVKCWYNGSGDDAETEPEGNEGGRESGARSHDEQEEVGEEQRGA